MAILKRTHLIITSLVLVVMLLMLAGFTGWYRYKHVNDFSQAQVDQLQVSAGNVQDKTALRQLRNAAKENQVLAQNALGQAYLQRNNMSLALHWLEKAAQQQSNPARVTLGKLYLQGTTGVGKSYTRALSYFQPAAEAGDAAAAYYLGIMYKQGYGVEIDASQSAHWLKVAADQQLPNAMFMLANAYRYGEGVTQDNQAALKLYQSAADMELPEAIQVLAIAYHNGELGLQPDPAAYQQQMLEIAHALKHPAQMP